jgi:hypothetical protein
MMRGKDIKCWAGVAVLLACGAGDQAGLEAPIRPVSVATGEAWGTSEARQMLEHGIETGRGGCYLRLTPEQYRALRGPDPLGLR